MLKRAKPLRWSFRRRRQHSEKTDKRYLCRASSFSNSESKPLRRRVLIEEGLAKSSKKQHFKNTDKWVLCKAGSFSYGESMQTPPLEGTSLHQWNNSVERPLGILSLLTTVYNYEWNHTATCCHICRTCPPKAVCRTCPKMQSRKESYKTLKRRS